MDKQISEADCYGKQLLFLLDNGFAHDTKRSDCSQDWLSLTISSDCNDSLIVSLAKESDEWRLEAETRYGHCSDSLVYYGSLEYVLDRVRRDHPKFACFIPDVLDELRSPLKRYSVAVSYTVDCTASSGPEAEDIAAAMVRDTIQNVHNNLNCTVLKQED